MIAIAISCLGVGVLGAQWEELFHRTGLKWTGLGWAGLDWTGSERTASPWLACSPSTLGFDLDSVLDSDLDGRRTGWAGGLDWNDLNCPGLDYHHDNPDDRHETPLRGTDTRRLRYGDMIVRF